MQRWHKAEPGDILKAPSSYGANILFSVDALDNREDREVVCLLLLVPKGRCLLPKVEADIEMSGHFLMWRDSLVFDMDYGKKSAYSGWKLVDEPLVLLALSAD